MRGKKDLVLRKREELIVHSARQLFLQKGFEQTTILEIAKRAEIAVGTIYKHFESKERLLEGVMAHQMERLLRSVNRAVKYHHTPLKRLKIYAALRLRIAEKNRPLYDRDIYKLRGSAANTHHRSRFLTDLCEEMIESRLLQSGSVLVYVHLIDSLIDTLIYTSLIEKAQLPKGRFEESFYHLFFKGVGTPS